MLARTCRSRASRTTSTVTVYRWFVPRKDNFPVVAGALVGDSTVFGPYGAVAGRRWRLDASYAPDLEKDKPTLDGVEPGGTLTSSGFASTSASTCRSPSAATWRCACSAAPASATPRSRSTSAASTPCAASTSATSSATARFRQPRVPLPAVRRPGAARSCDPGHPRPHLPRRRRRLVRLRRPGLRVLGQRRATGCRTAARGLRLGLHRQLPRPGPQLGLRQAVEVRGRRGRLPDHLLDRHASF